MLGWLARLSFIASLNEPCRCYSEGSEELTTLVWGWSHIWTRLDKHENNNQYDDYEAIFGRKQ